MYRFLNQINGPDDVRPLNHEELKRLSAEIRDFLLNNVSKTGGHLSSNLGIVELSIALHLMYDSPKDKIIFDVGHQAYVHKILTGRRETFDTLRQYNGISGFLKRHESDHDCFEAGHSSTSISAAAGFAKARSLKGKDHHIVAVIGDGSLTGGMAFEAMNHIGHTKERVTVVLNDNEMSISENVGGLSKYLGQLRTTKTYYKMKDSAHQMLDALPHVGVPVVKGIQRFKGSLKHFFVPGILFEDLGFTYIGPVDGHDIQGLKDALQRAKDVKGPSLVHVVTKKGKGYIPAEEAPDLYHGVGKFDVKSGIAQPSQNAASKPFSDIFGDKLVELASKDERIVAVTAAMPSGTGLNAFRKTYPKRYVDVGIAEQHAVTFCAGLATEGMRPVFAVYSTFLQRAYDQVLHDVCIQNLPVVFAIDRAGLVGQDGETHHGVFDIAFLKHLPNMRILSPMDASELESCLEEAFKSEGPVAIRYPRGNASRDVETAKLLAASAMDEPVLIRGSLPCEQLVLSIGHMTNHALKAYEGLQDHEKEKVAVMHVRQLKPFTEETIRRITDNTKRIITIEDGMREGGFGQSVCDWLNDGVAWNRLTLTIMGYPMGFVPHGDVSILYKEYGMDADGIIAEIRKGLE